MLLEEEYDVQWLFHECTKNIAPHHNHNNHSNHHSDNNDSHNNTSELYDHGCCSHVEEEFTYNNRKSSRTKDEKSFKILLCGMMHSESCSMYWVYLTVWMSVLSFGPSVSLLGRYIVW